MHNKKYYLHTIDEDDLQRIVTELNDIFDVQTLGLGLGIRMSSLEKIKTDNPQVEQQKTQVIYYWLKRRNIIREKQGERPTWTGLAYAVARLDPTLSEKIQHQHC